MLHEKTHSQNARIVFRVAMKLLEGVVCDVEHVAKRKI